MKVAAVRPGVYRSSSRERQTSLPLPPASLRRWLLAAIALPAALTLSVQGGTLLGLVALVALGALWRQGWRTQGGLSEALRVAIVLGSAASVNLLFLSAFRELAGAVLLLTTWGVALRLAWASQGARARRVALAMVLGASALTLALWHPHVMWPHLMVAALWLAAGLLAPAWEWSSTRRRKDRP
jgi:hypothetical protein